MFSILFANTYHDFITFRDDRIVWNVENGTSQEQNVALPSNERY